MDQSPEPTNTIDEPDDQLRETLDSERGGFRSGWLQGGLSDRIAPTD